MAKTSRRSFLAMLGIGAITAASPLVKADVQALAPQKVRRIDPTRSLREPIRLRGRYHNGSPCNIKMWDLGDHLVAWDVNENVFEAYTSRYDIDGNIEFYVQTPKDLAQYSGDIEVFRWAEDEAYLDALNVNVSSLRIV